MMARSRLLAFTRAHPEIAATGGELCGRKIGRKSASGNGEDFVAAEQNEQLISRFFNRFHVFPFHALNAANAFSINRKRDVAF